MDQSRTLERARNLALGLLSCMGRCIITGMLSASGNQFKDWSAAYRLFKGEHMSLEELFGGIRKQVVLLKGSHQGHTYAHMDDTPYCVNGERKSKGLVGRAIPWVPCSRLTSCGDRVSFKFHCHCWKKVPLAHLGPFLLISYTALQSISPQNPACLISTDQYTDIRLSLQAYIRRWEIEVGFRDQKTLIGCGQAQVREQNAVILPGPKWYKNQKKSRVTTGDILNRLRTERWVQGVNIDFSDFVNIEEKLAKLGKMANPVFSSMFYIRN